MEKDAENERLAEEERLAKENRLKAEEQHAADQEGTQIHANCMHSSAAENNIPCFFPQYCDLNWSNPMRPSALAANSVHLLFNSVHSLINSIFHRTRGATKSTRF